MSSTRRDKLAPASAVTRSAIAGSRRDAGATIPILILRVIHRHLPRLLAIYRRASCAINAHDSGPNQGRPYFFCGIGGSGMLPLALILRGQGLRGRRLRPLARPGPAGAEIRVPARARHRAAPAGRQRRHARRADPGDLRRGRGDRARRAVAARRARRAGDDAAPSCWRSCSTRRRVSIAVGGTSGKSTTTGMIGWILHHAGRDPTIMNGAVMKNFVTPDDSVRRARSSAAATPSSARSTRATARSRCSIRGSRC